MRVAALLQSLNNPALPGIDLSLERVLALLDALGNPQRKLPPTIHVAGTNGKGSTIAFMRAMLEAAGKKVHVYTSPELVRFNERIVIAGKEISDEVLADVLGRVEKATHLHPVTSFEATTAAAFLAFSEHLADFLLLETGMGGRLDATNVVERPIATVITPIAMDHQEFLGADLAAIAAEKAGILKPGVPCIIGHQQPEALKVIKAEAQRLGVSCISSDEYLSLPLPALVGEHQRDNAALAAATLRRIDSSFPQDELVKGVQSVRWPARLQKLRHGPLVELWGKRGDMMLDGGHNAHAAQALAAWIKAQTHPVVMICGMMQRKDAKAFFEPLASVVEEVACVSLSDKAYEPPILAQAAKATGIRHATAHYTVLAAVESLARYRQATLLVAGSLVLAGQVLKNHE